MSDPLKPTASLLCKLGSIIVHVEEGLSEDQHDFDWIAAQMAFQDAEVVAWMGAMRKLALLPVKRRKT